MERCCGYGWRDASWGLRQPIDDARPLKPGDTIISWGSPEIGGYGCELGRTIILGQPTEEQRRYFELMLGAQEAALNALEPGVPCSEVDKAVLRYARRHKVEHLLLHHTGHGKGLEIHEAPFFRRGVHTTAGHGVYM